MNVYYLALGLLLGWLMVRAYLRRRRKLREILGPPRLDDAAVERILREGSLEVDEQAPLDLDEIARAEEDFWREERWDPAEEDRF